MTKISSVVYSFCSENCLSKILFYYINIKSLSFLITLIYVTIKFLLRLFPLFHLLYIWHNIVNKCCEFCTLHSLGEFNN